MRLRLITLLLCTSASLCVPGTLPLTVREVGLMLRSGYSSEAVMHELAARHFAEMVDPDVEKNLTQAGGNATLLEALRTGAYQASAAEISALEKKQTAPEQRVREATAVAGEPVPSKKDKTMPVAKRSGDEVYRLLKGDLVSCQKGVVAPIDDEPLLAKKLFLFFFSANWSPAGRKFTPRLVDYYQRVTAQHPEVEVIFFSTDRSQFGMETYMNQSKMPWPAVAFPRINGKAAGMDTDAVKDMPSLILVDNGGRILSQSSSEQKPNEPEKVLADLDRILAQGSAGQVARAR